MTEKGKKRLAVQFVKDRLTRRERRPRCGFCSMPAIAICDNENCRIPLCGSHLHKVGSEEYCKLHKPLTFTVPASNVLA